MFLIDTTGRRSLLIWGAALQALFLFIMAGLGNKPNPSKADADGLVASVMLFNLAFSGYVDCTVIEVSFADYHGFTLGPGRRLLTLYVTILPCPPTVDSGGKQSNYDH